MLQRVRIPHRGQGPSSVTQLPILTALHARSPTLFGVIIHHVFVNVNTFSKIRQIPIYRAVTLMSVISTEPKASGEIRSLRMEITDFSTSLRSARNDIKKTQQLDKPEFGRIFYGF